MINDEFVNVELARLRGVVEALRGGAVGAHRPFGEAAGRLLGIVRERLEALRATVVFAEGAGEGHVAAAVDAEGRVVPVQELDRRPVAMEPTRRARAGDITFRGRSIRVDFDTGAGGQGWLELTFREVRSGLSHHEHQLALAMARWLGKELQRRAEERLRLDRMLDPPHDTPLRLTA